MKIQLKQNRQVRTGTFETNSSSTHSVSISLKGAYQKANRPLVENNILYPERLDDYTHGFGESSATVCSTKDEKAAIVCNWIYCKVVNYFDKKQWDEVMSLLTDYINQKLGSEAYDRIDQEFTESFYPSSEYGDSYLDSLDGEDFTEDQKSAVYAELDKLVKYILDDKYEIVDSDTAY